MKYILYFLLLNMTALLIHAQEVTFITTLDNSIEETSGLIYLDQKIITHNDSGDEPALYEVDSLSGAVTRKVIVGNASNVDWEDICADDEFIYIGDFGNNAGSRQDLKVYKILIEDYRSTENDTISADTIKFNYVEQTDFTPANQNTNFDAETMICYGENLYIFTKNWIDNKSNIYKLPKNPGNYSVEQYDRIDSDGLLTGGTYNPEANVVLLTGYSLIFPYIITISDFSEDKFSTGNMDRKLISLGSDNSVQLEAITYVDKNHFLITTERSFTGNSSMHAVYFDNLTSVPDLKKKSNNVYPNPATTYIKITHENFFSIEIYSLKGSLQKVSYENQVDISDLTPGSYFVKIKDRTDKVLQNQILIVNEF